MPKGESSPTFYPPAAAKAFESQDALRRLARVSNFEKGSRLLVLGAGTGETAVFLAKALECDVVAVDADESLLSPLRDRVRAEGLGERLEVKTADPRKPAFKDAQFDGVIVHGRFPLGLQESVETLRPLLAPKGRLCLVYPVKVGRFPHAPALAFWENRLGEALRLPKEALQLMERAGYEPQDIETLFDAELDEFYKAVESGLPKISDAGQVASLKEEIALHRAQAGNATVTFAQLIGRRKEPGEKPPPSRSSG